jgi:DNA-binding NarL/FixJ family response regulator
MGLQVLLSALHRRREQSKQTPASARHAQAESAGLLTPREREIVHLIAEGSSSKEVPDRLQISVKTVDTHRSNLMRKLNLHSVGQLVRYAIRNRLIEP